MTQSGFENAIVNVIQIGLLLFLFYIIKIHILNYSKINLFFVIEFC